MFYTEKEKTEKKYLVENAIGAARNILKDKHEITTARVDYLDRKDRTSFVVLPEFNDIVDRIIKDTLSFA